VFVTFCNAATKRSRNKNIRKQALGCFVVGLKKAAQKNQTLLLPQTKKIRGILETL
jgi:hypothetical protein